MKKEDWKVFLGTRGAIHKSGLVIHAKPTLEDDEYLLKYYNLEYFNGNESDKLALSKEFSTLMKEVFKDNATYIIPKKVPVDNLQMINNNRFER